MVERVESRVLLTDFTVTNTGDSANDPNSLRYALSHAATSDRILFAIPTTDPNYHATTGSWTILVGSPLPAVISPSILIDGLSQQSQPGASSAHPAIEITPSASFAGNGLTLTSGGVTVRGLAIDGFQGVGISVGPRASGNLITGNDIGTEVTGTAARPNAGGGILVLSSGNTIGGLTSGDRNIISGNGVDGIFLTDAGATHNLVQGNFIGTDATGTKPLGNTRHGVSITQTNDTSNPSGSDNTIGGTAAGAGNVISGNGGFGIVIFGPHGGASGNLVQGNLVGTDVSGTQAIGNAGDGVVLSSASDNTVGGTTPAARNVISGNGKYGVVIESIPSTGNLVQGNFIGTDPTGTSPIGNANHGVIIQLGASANMIGGTAAGAGNTIDFNAGSGVVVDKGTGNAILSNSISANAGGGIVLTNGGNNNQVAPVLTDALFYADRIVVDGSLSVRAGTGYLVQFFGNNPPSGQGRTLLGSQAIGSQPADGSVTLSFTTSNSLPPGSTITAIASVTTTPVESSDPMTGDTSAFSSAVTLVNPFIVTNTLDFGIGSLRFAVQAANADLANDDTITFRIPTKDPGFSAATGSWTIPVNSGLTISKSPTEGGVQHTVFIDGLSQQSQPGASAAHPVIVITPGGQFSGSDGLTIASGGNTVGGLVIHGFPGNGLVIGSGASRNLVTGSFIGTDPLGTAAVGNGGAGIAISGPNNTVGGTAAGARNVISGNKTYGVSISDTAGNAILGDDIGAGSDGATAVGNVLDGIFLDNASVNTVSGNVISANGVGQDAAGINMTGSGSSGNLMRDNRIGTNAAGTAALGNSLHGIFIGDGASNNTVGPGNVISGNGLATNQGVGVYLFGTTTTGNQVIDNRIGTDANGASRLTETVVGVLISQSPANTVQGNLISGNRFVGLEIAGATASGNQVLGNLIGTNAAGTRAIPNGFDGVFINDAPNNTIGGTGAGAGNLISGNGSVGIQLFGPQAVGNVVEGNAIGLDSAGRLTLPNPAGGIFVNTGPQANQIGGAAPGQANTGQRRPSFSLSGFHQAHRARRVHTKSHAVRQKAVPHHDTRPSLRPHPYWPITGGVVNAAALAAPLPKGILSIRANSPLNGKGPVTGRT
jgi:parallel beta-helix repeat protein